RLSGVRRRDALAAHRRGQRRRQPSPPPPRPPAVAAQAGDLMPAATAQQSQQHVAGLDVLVGGAQMDPKWRDATTEVKVVDTLALPDMAVVKLLDPRGENVDTQPFQLGAEIEIKAASIED